MRQESNKATLDINSTREARLSILYIIFILVLSLPLTYLVMSEFNSCNVFVNSDKMIVYVLLNIVITEILTFVITYIGNMVI